MFPKTVPVRLKREELQALRIARFMLDGGRCVDCHTFVWLDAPLENPLRMHLAHEVSRGAGGSDTIENTRTKCGRCHGREHNGGKPCPPK